MYILYDMTFATYKESIFVEKKNKSITKYTYHENILSVLQEKVLDTKETTHLLLDDEKFELYSFDIFFDFETPCTIHDIKQIVTDKTLFINQNYGNS